MQFKFPKTEYKWCPHCSANIRSRAEWCRICRRELPAEAFAGLRKFSVRGNLDLVQEWLPAFAVLRDRLDPETQARFLESHGKTTIESLFEKSSFKDEDQETLRKLDQWPDAPPNAAVASLLLDILVALASQGADIEGICQEPRLQVLGLTAERILTELTLRENEEESARDCCPFCAERATLDAQSCRHCSSLIGPNAQMNMQPVASLDRQPFDQVFLKDVMLHLAARHCLLGLEPDQRLKEALAANAIEANAVTTESERLTNLRADELEVSHPLSGFRQRFYESNADCANPRSAEIKDLIDLGYRLREKKRYFEAELVFNYALARASSLKTDPQAMKSTTLRELSNLYLDLGDFEKWIEFNDKSLESIYAISPEYRKMRGPLGTVKASFDLLFQIGSPEKEDLDAALKKVERLLDVPKPSRPEALKAMREASTPGYSDGARALETNRLQIIAKIHTKNGEYAQAQKILRSLLSELGHEWTHNIYRMQFWLQLAEIYERLGQHDECLEAYNEALDAGRQAALKSPDIKLHGVRDSCRAYGKYLKNAGRLAEAEEYMRKAIAAHQTVAEQTRLKLAHPAASALGVSAAILREYADILKSAARENEAASLLEQADEMTAQYELLKEKWLEIRRSFEEISSENE